MIKTETLTRIFLSQWNKSADDANVQYYSRKWWFSSGTRNPFAFRLTDEGYQFLIEELNLKCYEIPFTEHIELNPQTIIFLEKYLDCPYYLTNFSVTVFSEKRSFELYMFSDDIRKFGLVKAMNARLKSTVDNNNQ